MLTCFFSCSQRTQEEIDVTRGVYHWETQLKLSEPEIHFLKEHQIQHVYLRFFDVDINQENRLPIPIASTDFDTSGLNNKKVIPVVFITNRTLKWLSNSGVDSLASRITRKIKQQWKEVSQQGISEIQIDCDWSESTRAGYFRLLEKIKTSLAPSCKLSATIRLHQVKYFKRTGVPPVSRGMLMYYNMGEVTKWETENSILDTELASTYLYNFDRYPLHLDVALPLFSWGAIFRDEKLVQLIHNLKKTDLDDTSRFVQVSANRYQVKRSTYLDGYYCYHDDLIRIEEITEEQLAITKQQLETHLPREDRRVVFYHLHEKMNFSQDPWKGW